jgi:dTDP-4-dehydrorhamnose 3,5-epimerase
MTKITESELIKGVYIIEPSVFGDDRGRFLESFRKEWFPQRSWDVFQTNRSESIRGVVRGLHYHYHQVDYWFVMSGMIRACLADIRPNSPTYKATQTIDMGDDNMIGLFIPVGVAHGFATLSERVILSYIVDNYYNSSDEFGVAWNDPELNIDWGLAPADVVLSGRDASNPMLKDIDPKTLMNFDSL